MRLRLGLVLVALFAAALVWLLAADDEDPGRPLATLGYNEIFRPSDPGNKLLEDSGARFARTPLSWSAVEQRPGELDFSGPDRVTLALAQRGLRPLWVVTSAPCWAVPRANGDCDPREQSLAPAPEFLDEYAEFVVAVAERYRNAFGIEVWNEPNIPNFWRPRPDPDLYRELLITTLEAVRESDSEVPIVLAGPSPVVPEEAERKPTKIVYTEFLERVLEPPGAPVPDAVGFHPYSLLIRSPDPVATSLELFESAAATIEAAAPGLPIWVTEVGLTTAGRNAVSDEAQADGLATLYEAFSELGSPVVAIHRFYDQADPPFPFEAGFGVVADDGRTPKPAYCALAATAGASGAEACD